jgi:carbonic anhydrase/acetyltransferase-like protein (isoleucine patch superfamily)
MSQYGLDGRLPRLIAGGVWLAPTAQVIGNVTLGREASIWFSAVVRGDNEAIVIGDRTNVQDGCVLHSDPGAPLHIGNDTTIGHRAVRHGCTIGDTCLIGIGAVILNRASIGERSIVGASALVTETKQFPPGSLIVGAPARVVRELTPAEQQMIATNAAHYVRNAKRFTKGLKHAETLRISA